LWVFGVVALVTAEAAAQAPLTLADAMQQARTATPGAQALDASTAEAAARVRQARAGYFPTVDFTTGVQRGNHPVFVFSSLLAQQRFAAANFDIDALNHPAAVNNVRSALAIDQPLFDGGQTRLATRAAELSRDLASASADGARQDLALRAAGAFVSVLQLESQLRAVDAAVEAADADLARAESRRDVGMVTEADVLAVRVHVAVVRERQVGVAEELAVARMRLNEAIGAPLDAEFRPVMPPADVAAAAPDVPGALVAEAAALRSDLREADLQEAIAETAMRAARAAWLPRVGAHGGWEFNGDRFSTQRSSWVAGAQVRINLFRGFADTARLAEAREAARGAAAERARVARAVELEVREAAARLSAARARAATGEAALAQARESQRILRDRYDTGLATIGDLLRAAGAVLDAESRATTARMDVISRSLALQRATGRL
jgi:outer membrane protein TolC